MEFYLSALLNVGIVLLSFAVFLIVAGFIGGIGWVVSIAIFWLFSGIIKTETLNLDKAACYTFIFWFVVGAPLGIMAMSKVYTDLTTKQVERVKVVTENTIEPYIFVSQTTPKHYYVTIKHVKTGMVYERQYVSKHCNSYSDNKPGTVYNLKVQTWHYEDAPGVEYIVFTDLYNEFCGSTK